MIPSSTELIYFLEVANSLNLSRASERLGISQPSLSLAMKKLEHAVGTELLLRHKHGVTLTQAGKQLYAHARELLQSWENTKSRALASHHQVQGCFTLGCHSTIAHHIVAEVLPNLLEKYPQLEIHLKHDVSRKILEQVVNLSLDIGIVANPIKQPDLVIQKLCNDEVTFWVGPGNRSIQNISSEHAVIICDPEIPQAQALLRQNYKNGLKSNRIITTSCMQVIAHLTAKGSGIGILPSRVANALYPKKLQRVPKTPVVQDEICLIYRHELRYIRALQTLIQELKSLF